MPIAAGRCAPTPLVLSRSDLLVTLEGLRGTQVPDPVSRASRARAPLIRYINPPPLKMLLRAAGGDGGTDACRPVRS